MATNKPRLTITLPEKTAEQLRRISELTGNSQSSIVSECLEQAEAVFERLILVLDAAEKAKAAVSRESMKSLNEAQRRIEKQLGLALSDFNSVTEPFLGAFGEGTAPAGGTSKAPRRRKATPLSNRGVR